MLDQYRMLDGSAVARFVPGKVVCVGRNYAAHARELNNPVPDEPVLFIKPASALVDFTKPLQLPQGEAIHYEAELAVLITQPLTMATEDQVLQAIGGIGLALDLTKRALQSRLKAKSLPWELAKGFDGACPVTPFVEPGRFEDLGNLAFSLWIDGETRQRGNTSEMLFPVVPLIQHISKHFTLLPGDLVLTGTPEGVGELEHGMRLRLDLASVCQFSSEVTIEGGGSSLQNKG